MSGQYETRQIYHKNNTTYLTFPSDEKNKYVFPKRKARRLGGIFFKQLRSKLNGVYFSLKRDLSLQW